MTRSNEKSRQQQWEEQWMQDKRNEEIARLRLPRSPLAFSRRNIWSPLLIACAIGYFSTHIVFDIFMLARYLHSLF